MHAARASPYVRSASATTYRPTAAAIRSATRSARGPHAESRRPRRASGQALLPGSGTFFRPPHPPKRGRHRASSVAATGVTRYAISRQSAISRYLAAAPLTTIHRYRIHPMGGRFDGATSRGASADGTKHEHRGRAAAVAQARAGMDRDRIGAVAGVRRRQACAARIAGTAGATAFLRLRGSRQGAVGAAGDRDTRRRARAYRRACDGNRRPDGARNPGRVGGMRVRAVRSRWTFSRSASPGVSRCISTAGQATRSKSP